MGDVRKPFNRVHIMITKLTTLNGIRRKSDKSVTLSFTTCLEQSSEELKYLDEMFQQTCVIAIKPEETPFLDSEIKDLDSLDMDLEDTTKTPSKRLRSVMYLLWKQESVGEFKDFYKNRMERLIDQIKNRLD